MRHPHQPLPYFDWLLTELDQGNRIIEQAFGRHVHWGYWHDPALAKNNAEDFAQATENLTQQILEAAEISSNNTILDVGCGFGGSIASINEKLIDTHIFGLNIDRRQLLRAKQLIIPKAQNTIDFIQGDAYQLPFSDSSLDIVIAVECIFHFADRFSFLQETSRVLKPTGRLVLSDFVPKDWYLPFNQLKIWDFADRWFYGRCNLKCSNSLYQQWARQTGLIIRQNRDITRNTLPTYDYLKKISHKIMRPSRSAIIETLWLAAISHFHQLNYRILVFEKFDKNHYSICH